MRDRVLAWLCRDRFDIDAEIDANRAKPIPGYEKADPEIMARVGKRRAAAVLQAQHRTSDAS